MIIVDNIPAVSYSVMIAAIARAPAVSLKCKYKSRIYCKKKHKMFVKLATKEETLA